MKPQPLAMAIARLTTGEGRYLVEAAQVESLYKPHQKPEMRRVPVQDVRYVVELISIEGEFFELKPALALKDGIVRRVIHTPDYTHVFSVKTDFATANVIGHLQSFEHGSHEYVYMKGEWAITRITTNA